MAPNVAPALRGGGEHGSEGQMSSSELAKSGGGLGYTHVASKWGWFVALGVVLLLLGVTCAR